MLYTYYSSTIGGPCLNGDGGAERGRRWHERVIAKYSIRRITLRQHRSMSMQICVHR